MQSSPPETAFDLRADSAPSFSASKGRNASRPRGGKLLGLEVLRFIAAFAVLVWHYQHFTFDGQRLNVLRDKQPFYAVLQPFYEYGWYGVQIFWSISGCIFFWRYRASVAEGAVSGWRFFVLRFSRLYPLHFVTLLLVAVLQYAYIARLGHPFVYQNNDGNHFLLQLFMASHWGLQSVYSFNGPIWSISVEVLLYLIFFVALRIVGSSPWVNLAAVGVAVGLKAAGMATPISDCLGFFYGGGLAAILLQGHPRVAIRRMMWCVALGAPVLVLPFARSVSADFVYYFLLAYLPALLFCLSQPLPVSLRLERTIEAAGNMTYSSYLLHFPIQLSIALYYASRSRPIPVYQNSLFLVFIGITGIAAYWVFRLVESPAQDGLRRRMIGAGGTSGRP